MKRLALVAALALVAGCGGAVLPQVHDEGSRLALAQRLYDKGDYTLAVEALAPFGTSGSGSAWRTRWTPPASMSIGDGRNG